MSSKLWTLAFVTVAGIGLVIAGLPFFKVALAAAACYGMLRFGFGLIGALARPIPEPPPPGELRKVKLQFRCSLCGTEVRMTAANDQIPEPPRHCMEDMELTANALE